jgi:hypothetical protein
MKKAKRKFLKEGSSPNVVEKDYDDGGAFDENKKIDAETKKIMKTGKMAPQPDRDESKSFTKETKVGRNATKVERIKKSDDEIGYQRSIKKRENDYRDSRRNFGAGGLGAKNFLKFIKKGKYKDKTGKTIDIDKEAAKVKPKDLDLETMKTSTPTKMKNGGLVRSGKPKLAKKGWR